MENNSEVLSGLVLKRIRTLLKSIKQSGAQVALVAVPELSLMGIVAGKPSDSPIYKELAKEEGGADRE